MARTAALVAQTMVARTAALVARTVERRGPPAARRESSCGTRPRWALPARTAGQQVTRSPPGFPSAGYRGSRPAAARWGPVALGDQEALAGEVGELAPPGVVPLGYVSCRLGVEPAARLVVVVRPVASAELAPAAEAAAAARRPVEPGQGASAGLTADVAARRVVVAMAVDPCATPVVWACPANPRLWGVCAVAVLGAASAPVVVAVGDRAASGRTRSVGRRQNGPASANLVAWAAESDLAPFGVTEEAAASGRSAEAGRGRGHHSPGEEWVRHPAVAVDYPAVSPDLRASGRGPPAAMGRDPDAVGAPAAGGVVRTGAWTRLVEWAGPPREVPRRRRGTPARRTGLPSAAGRPCGRQSRGGHLAPEKPTVSGRCARVVAPGQASSGSSMEVIGVALLTATTAPATSHPLRTKLANNGS